MSSRGGRDRPRRDYPSRSEEKNRGNAPPSRHLWVGNLSHSLTERALSNQFREFGELESVAFQPARSYAFVNFIDQGAAFAAFEALQGFVLAGNPLRIEFTKAEKSSASKHDDHYTRPRDELRSRARPDPIHHNRNPKPDTENTGPSPVLWVGFPQSLKVDEDSLYEAFAPFGEIEKVSMIPGRTFAFIRYKNVNSASRAINNLQGKLFNNPRVHISFAKSDSGPSNSSRNDPPSPRGRRHDRYREPEHTRRSPRYVDPNSLDSFDRKRRNVPFESPRFQDNIGLPGNIYGRNSPMRDRDYRRQGPFDDEEWDLPEDALVYHGAKKPKNNNMIPPEAELPEYPFFETEQVKHVLPRPPEFSHHNTIDNNNLGHFGYHKQIIPQQPWGDFGNSSYNIGSENVVEWKRPTPEGANAEWKWEGIIAKGGSSICRARCFPVGKVPDMNLPEFLDCTARTNLDDLGKHYYRAAQSWVVFFVPESDADMGLYNEFMNYLGEKQRAAVSKIDDKTTLFLVPPSDFSEKILKVPGKLSISGVILRLDSSSSNAGIPPPPPPPPSLQPDPYLVSSHVEASRTSFAPVQSFQNHGNPRPNLSAPALPLGPAPFRNMVEPIVENQPDHLHHQNLTAGGRNLPPPPRVGGDFMMLPPPSNSIMMPQYNQQDQLAQLASYLGNPRQSASGVSMGEDHRQPSDIISDNAYGMSQTQSSPNMQIGNEYHQASQYHHVQMQPQPFQQQQVVNVGQVGQSGQVNAHEEGDADPQKRLQATLELAATLLKQIQQGKS